MACPPGARIDTDQLKALLRVLVFFLHSLSVCLSCLSIFMSVLVFTSIVLSALGCGPEPEQTTNIIERGSFQGRPFITELPIANCDSNKALQTAQRIDQKYSHEVDILRAPNSKTNPTELARAVREHYQVDLSPDERRTLIAWVDAVCPYRGDEEVRAIPDPDFPGIDLLPIRPRTKTAPHIDRFNIAQDVLQRRVASAAEE